MPIHGYPGGVITANPVAPTASVATGVWTTEQQLQAVSQGNWPGYEYPISRSLRFNSADSAYLNRTFGTPTNATTWTLSCWIKRSKFGTARIIMQAGATNTNNGLWSTWNSTDIVGISNSAGSALCTSTAVKRDPSAWSHLVVTNNAGTFTWYENNQNIASGSGTCNINQSGTTHYIGSGSGTNYFFDGYMTEINFIDGQALEPSSFGLNDPETGVWSPKRYTGTYGNNGFYLNFSDNSGTTSTTLGKDYSGNGNNWTPNNFSVTAGAGNDSLVDSPTSYGTDTGVGGEVRGNYATWNPLDKRISGASTFANGNLDATVGASGSTEEACATITFPSSGSWYCEMTCSNVASGNARIGIGNSAIAIDSRPANGYLYQQDGQKYVLGSASAYGSSYTTGDVIGIAFNASAGSITFYKNNTSQGAITGISTSSIWVITATGKATVWIANFGQRAFAYTAPSGFKALCTQNLPTPTIGATSTTQANDYFDVSIWTGNNASRNITNSGSMQPDFVWIKDRSRASSNDLVDAVRGVNKALISDSTAAEYTGSFVSSFNSDGFSLPANGLGDNFYTNISGDAFVGWQWKANGAGSSNTAGTITSTVSANTTAGFSIVTYTGTGANATVGHGLGVTPAMYIVKRRTGGIGNWAVWHTSLSNTTTSYILLDSTAAQSTSTSLWGSTAATSTTLGLGTSVTTNNSSDTYVAYCFAPVAGYSAFGSYTGNGSTDGPFVYTGFKPRFVMMKSSSSSPTNWRIFDIARDPYNVMIYKLSPNNSDAEYTDANTRIDFVSNGFKLRQFAGDMNASGETYIYAAFAESPFKYSLAR